MDNKKNTEQFLTVKNENGKFMNIRVEIRKFTHYKHLQGNTFEETEITSAVKQTEDQFIADAFESARKIIHEHRPKDEISVYPLSEDKYSFKIFMNNRLIGMAFGTFKPAGEMSPIDTYEAVVNHVVIPSYSCLSETK